jgi:flagellin
MVINTNIHAQVSANNLRKSQTLLGNSLKRLSSGSKIVNPSDDAAGLAVVSRIDAKTQRLVAARNNVANAVSFTQSQDGYLSNIMGALNRMSELSILAQDVTKTDADRSLYNEEFSQLAAYITTTSESDFNGVSLFSSNDLDVTIDSEGKAMTMEGINLAVTNYTGAIGSNISTTTAAASALTNVKTAINQLTEDRSKIGAYQSRLRMTDDQLTITRENLTAASSTIKDVDVAQETTDYSKFQILSQSGTAMLAQANQLPQSVLRLLQ